MFSTASPKIQPDSSDAFYQNTIGGVYAAPRLFLGDTQLLTGNRIFTDDLDRKLSTSISGILGMDCLRHYCIQFDFADQKIRFLAPDHLRNEDLGKKFPLTILFGNVFTHAKFFGQGSTYLIGLDTGYIGGVDATLSPKQFRKELQTQQSFITTTDPDKKLEIACFSKGIFGDVTYTNLTIAELNDVSWAAQNLLGLQFLARHLVTLNFPKRMMYLKQQSVGPLASGFFLTIEAEQFWAGLGTKGLLPGLPNSPQGELLDSKLDNSVSYPFSKTFDFRKTGNTSIYHYSVGRESEESPWKLQKAWRTDGQERVIEEYHIQ